jgi:hypothetical protein
MRAERAGERIARRHAPARQRDRGVARRARQAGAGQVHDEARALVVTGLDVLDRGGPDGLVTVDAAAQGHVAESTAGWD